tara:strand:+ start:248 stop:460 length:213 start_codon:yes stop_codon:yes gene_type:complete
MQVRIDGLFKQILNSIHDDLYVELSEAWEDESTEYYNANWVRNIREAQDVDELKDALIRIVKGLDKYLRD